MNLKLTPEQRQIIEDELKAGHFRTAQEVIGQALQALKERERATRNAVADKPNLLQQQAVQEMLAFIEKNHVRLSGISVKDLIHEGHCL